MKMDPEEIAKLLSEDIRTYNGLICNSNTTSRKANNTRSQTQESTEIIAADIPPYIRKSRPKREYYLEECTPNTQSFPARLAPSRRYIASPIPTPGVDEISIFMKGQKLILTEATPQPKAQSKIINTNTFGSLGKRQLDI